MSPKLPYEKKGVIFLVGVKLRDGESFEHLYKRFKKSVEKSGILSDIKKHEFFEKPSVKKKKKAIAAKKRLLKKLKKRRMS